MNDEIFNKIFENKFDIIDNKIIKLNSLINTNQFTNIDLDKKHLFFNYINEIYNIYNDFKKTLEEYYIKVLKNIYISYNNCILFFDEFLKEFEKNGVSYSTKSILDIKDINNPFNIYIPRINNFLYYIQQSLDELINEDAYSDNNAKALIFKLNDIAKEFKDFCKNSKYNGLYIFDKDDFAKKIFNYSSFSNLLESVNIYFRSIYSLKVDKILIKVEEELSYSDFFTEINLFDVIKINRRYGNNILAFLDATPISKIDGGKAILIYDNLNNKNSLFKSSYLDFNSFSKPVWISEKGIYKVNSIVNNFDETIGKLFYIKINNEYINSIVKSEDILNDEEIFTILNKLKLDQYNFLQYDFFHNKKISEIRNYIYEIIKKESSLAVPYIIENIKNILNSIKLKYIKVLKSQEEVNTIFEDIEKSLIQNTTFDGNVIYSDVFYFLSDIGRITFKENDQIIKSIYADNMYGLYGLNNNSFNLFNLFKKCINFDYLDNFLKYKINKEENEVDLYYIFKEYLNNIIEDYKNNINKYYINIDSEIYKNLESAIINNVILKKIKTDIVSELREIQKKYEDKEDYEGFIYGLEVSYERITDVDFLNYIKNNLLKNKEKVLNFSDRLSLLDDRTYKEYISELLQNIDSGFLKEKHISMLENNLKENFHSDYDKFNFKTKLDNNEIYKKLSILILENFKKEGAELNSEEKTTFSVKLFNKKLNSENNIEKRNLTFSEISNIMNLSLLREGSNIPYTFSSFLSKFRDILSYPNTLSSHNIYYKLLYFWLKTICINFDLSNVENLKKNIILFLENIFYFKKIADENYILQFSIEASATMPERFGIERAFSAASKHSRLDTFKNLVSLLKFYHNNETIENLMNLIKKSKYLDKLYLLNYQKFLKSYIDVNSIIEHGGLLDNKVRNITGPILKKQIYELKKNIEEDDNIGKEKAEKLLPSERIESIKIFDLESFSIDSESFDKAVELMYNNFDSRSIISLENIISTVKQINDIKKYIVFAKPKDEMVLDNNYLFYKKNNNKFRFRTLGDLDPAHFTIGVETECCQTIGGPGEAAAIDSFINPNAGVIILEVEDGDKWSIVSQSYFHVVPDKKYFILDNIEAGKKNNIWLESKIGFSFHEAYAVLAKKLLNKGFEKVLCGKKFTVVFVNESLFNSEDIGDDPRHFEISEQGLDVQYSDFSPSDSYNLGEPNFEVPHINEGVFASIKSIRNEILIKISNNFLAKNIKNKNLLKLSKYLNNINLYSYVSKVLLLEKK